jgi:hypothetical protein
MILFSLSLLSPTRGMVTFVGIDGRDMKLQLVFRLLLECPRLFRSLWLLGFALLGGLCLCLQNLRLDLELGIPLALSSLRPRLLNGVGHHAAVDWRWAVSAQI